MGRKSDSIFGQVLRVRTHKKGGTSVAGEEGTPRSMYLARRGGAAGRQCEAWIFARRRQ